MHHGEYFKVISIGHGFNPTYVDLPAQEKASLKAQGVNKNTKSGACMIVCVLWILVAILCNALVFEPSDQQFINPGYPYQDQYYQAYTRCCPNNEDIPSDGGRSKLAWMRPKQ